MRSGPFWTFNTALYSSQQALSRAEWMGKTTQTCSGNLMLFSQ